MQSRIDWTTGGIEFYDMNERKTDSLKEKATKYGFMEDINKDFDPVPSRLSLEERYNLIMSIAGKEQEVINKEELRERLKENRFLRCYDGFEPSGRMHVAQGILRAVNVNKLIDAGCIFIFWVADWFAMLNNKYDGDIEKIKIVGRYFIEVWKAAGMKMSNVQFLWASDEINKRPNEYWMQVMDIARKNTINRIRKCATIMGRQEGEDLAVSQLFYPCMQCTDIFFLDVDICQLGVDQRKVNMLARDYKRDGHKPIIVSHEMMMGLLKGQVKMSKSNPASAIFMEDSAKDVQKKINSAWCVEKIADDNPVLDYCKNIVCQVRKEFLIKRTPDNGGDIVFKSYEELEAAFVAGVLHPEDLKNAVARVLNELIEPVRTHFQTSPHARKLLQLIQSWVPPKDPQPQPAATKQTKQ